MIFLWTLGFLLFPALVIHLSWRHKIVNKIGAIVICYAVGIVLGTCKIIPPAALPVQLNLQDFTILLALPLLFFSIDIRGWFRVAGVSLLSFLLQCVAVLAAATLGFLTFRNALGPETWKATGMLIGCYTGGTINLAAIGAALRVEQNVYGAINLADMLICPFYLLLAMTVLQRLLLLILPAFRHKEEAVCSGLASAAAASDYTDYRGIRDKRRLLGLAAALGLACLIAGVGGGLAFLAPEAIRPVVAILAVSSVGLICSFIPAVRRIEKTFQLGNYLIMVFILAISSQADLGKLMSLAPAALGLVGMVVALSVVFHVLLAAIFRIDADTTITTSIAGVFSPPFIPMVVSALKNQEMLVTGVITGLIGWVIGNYLGIGYAYLLRAIF